VARQAARHAGDRILRKIDLLVWGMVFIFVALFERATSNVDWVHVMTRAVIIASIAAAVYAAARSRQAHRKQ
jgi:hypothetical protein